MDFLQCVKRAREAVKQWERDNNKQAHRHELGAHGLLMKYLREETIKVGIKVNGLN